MAKKGYIETARQCSALVEDARRGAFKSVYLLMGEEPYYPEMVCSAIMENVLQEWERDFNETVCYGPDTDPDTVITAARRFPMMAERQLVVVKEAQAMKGVEELAVYCEKPLDSTILVLLFRGASADKRRALYKSVLKNGVVVESLPLREYEITGWINGYYASRGIEIDPDAAALLGESAGTDLGTISVETEKLLKNLPQGVKKVTAQDIEKNVGISRQFSIFELTRELSSRNAAACVRIASRLGASPRFFLPPAVSALFMHFYRILKYEALLMQDANPSQEAKASVLGVSPYFFREYEMAVRNYPLPRCISAISLLSEYDFKGKGGDAGEATPSDLLVELVVKLLNI